jgi:hypothetical protein
MSIAKTDGGWNKPKPRADCSLACMAIRSLRCVAWSSSTPHAELLSRRPLFSHYR